MKKVRSKWRPATTSLQFNTLYYSHTRLVTRPDRSAMTDTEGTRVTRSCYRFNFYDNQIQASCAPVNAHRNISSIVLLNPKFHRSHFPPV